MASYKKIFGEKFNAKIYTPLERGDHPELNNPKLLNAKGIQQSFIGLLLQWAVLLKAFDIASAVMFMSNSHALSYQGHLKKLRCIQ